MRARRGAPPCPARHQARRREARSLRTSPRARSVPQAGSVPRAGAHFAPLIFVSVLTLVSVVGLTLPSMALGVDPTAVPDVQPAAPTCAERFPEEGPAGVDLRLGCIVGEVVGLYTSGQARLPAPISTYAMVVGMLLVGILIVIWLAGRLVARIAGRRLAPVLPSEWWLCATCKSVNDAGVAHCYSCGSTPPDGPFLSTDDHPSIPQSFGSTRKRG